MFNITFSRKCKQSTVVNAEINTDLNCERPVLLFSWECEKQYAAALLENHLQDEFASAIKRAHQLAYERGWNDKTRKQKKATYFSEGFETTRDMVAG